MSRPLALDDPVKRKIIIAFSIVVACFAIWYAFVPRISWDGAAVGRVFVTVIDERTITPIAGATVELRHPLKDDASPTFSAEFYDGLIAEAATDLTGTAQFTNYFPAGGSSGFFGRSGQVVYANIWLQVSANGYQTTRLPLSRFSGENRSIRRDQNTDVTIRLSPATSPSLEPTAG